MPDRPTDPKPGDLSIDELAERFTPDEEDRFDRSYWTEVSNYLQHHKVRDRSVAEQSEFVRRMTKVSAEVFSDTVGGQNFRVLTFWICTRRNWSCNDATTMALKASSVEELSATVRRLAKARRYNLTLRKLGFRDNE